MWNMVVFTSVNMTPGTSVDKASEIMITLVQYRVSVDTFSI